MASSQYASYSSPEHSDADLPEVGRTRCYWALLSSELQFIYLDPVLQTHLDQQAELLVGKSLLSFVHPDEQASAKVDLGGVLESRTLHGSVTRVRFSRLSKVRRQLGYDGPQIIWSEAEKIALDSNYMAVDIVINWAAEGLVLCFIHATVDLTPSDNDEINKTGWSNWCGTPQMDPNQIQLLYRRLLVCVQRPVSMDRVFQILDNRDGRPLLLSWPPDQGQGTQRPNARDFSVLVENAQIGPGPYDGSDAKTSCTRRYKALQTMPSLVGDEVESIFIPHGSVIFACHKVNPSARSSSSSSATMQQLGYPPTQNYQPPSSSYYDSSSSYALPPISPYSTYPSQAAAAYAPQRWAQGSGESGASYPNTNPNPNAQPQQQQGHWDSQSPPHPVTSLPPAVSTLRSSSYPPPPQPGHHWQPPPPSGSPTFVDPAISYPRPSSPSFNSGNPNNSYVPSPSAESAGGDNAVPPSRRRVSPGSARESIQYVPNSSGSTPGGRAPGNRPSGVLKCSSCKATSSPEWRKGPSGRKELCNACGLRYARSRAKKEGHPQSQRRRKDKPAVASGGITKREASATPPSASPSYSTSSMRRSFGDTSFSSAGSTSGSEVYHPHPHTHHSHVLDEKLTPSPSPPVPPGNSMNFVHYAPGGPGHPSPFYSVPSPLSHPPVQAPIDEQNGVGSDPNGNSVGQGQGQGQSLPPLAAYVGRSAGPMLSTMPAASFERDRERERDRGRERERQLPPPVPLGMEPRHAHARRGILTQQG